MRLGAVEGLQRSILILRANWELIPLVWLQTVLAVALSLGSLVPFYFVLDVRLPDVSATPEESTAWLLDSLQHVSEQVASPAFWLAVVSSSAVALALFACYSFFQAGVFGVLTTADRQAPADGRGEAAWFRTYSWAEFQGRGGRHLWPFFWLFNLVLLFWLLLLLLTSLAFVIAALAAGGGGLGAGLAIGCASLFPLGFLFILLLFWSLFAQAVVAADDCGAWRGLKVGLRIMVRRLGAVVLLFVVMAFVSLAIAMVFLVLSLPLGGGWLADGSLGVVATLVLQGVQWFVTGLLQLLIAGAVVTVLRAERAVEERDRVAADG